MRWQLNTKVKDRENNLLRNEKWGVCQNITKFIVVKCESFLTTKSDTLKSSAYLLSFIDKQAKSPL